MPLTTDEAMMLKKLMAKANMPPVAADDFQIVHSMGEISEGLSPVSLGGTMSDGSKRREPDTPFEERGVSPRASYMTAPASPVIHHVPMPSGGYALDRDLNVGAITDDNKKTLPPFPEGVRDMVQWGKTLFHFGKYKDSNKCYHDVVISQAEAEKSYVKWCRSRTHSSTGQLQDFCHYMMHFFGEDLPGSQFVIPGTSQRRTFKQ